MLQVRFTDGRALQGPMLRRWFGAEMQDDSGGSPSGLVATQVAWPLANCRVVARLLRQLGYAILLFPSAQAFAEHREFDEAVCVLLDIDLGDGSGIELRIASEQRTLPCRSSI